MLRTPDMLVLVQRSIGRRGIYSLDMDHLPYYRAEYLPGKYLRWIRHSVDIFPSDVAICQTGWLGIGIVLERCKVGL